MKKLLLGIIIGGVVAIPAAVVADEYYPFDGLKSAKNIYQFNCNDRYDKGFMCNHVAVFADSGNKCYVTYDSRGAQSAISCVKDKER